jgi:hypothetical protein
MHGRRQMRCGRAARSASCTGRTGVLSYLSFGFRMRECPVHFGLLASLLGQRKMYRCRQVRGGWRRSSSSSEFVDATALSEPSHDAGGPESGDAVCAP